MKLCFLLLFAASAQAETGARSLFTTTRGTQSAEVLGGVNYQHGDGPTDPQLTLRLRGGISRYVSGIFDFSHSATQNDYVNSVEYKQSIQLIAGGAQFHIPLGRVEPYLLGELGTARFAARVDGASADAFRFAQMAGAGMRVAVNRWFGLSVEVRGIHVNDRGWISQYGVGAYTAFGGRP
jgi:outer membrane protein with beta-barrel domain